MYFTECICYPGCEPVQGPGNVIRYCGEGGRRVRRRLADINSPTWEEEEEVEECEVCRDPQCDRPYTTLSQEWRHVKYSSTAQDHTKCDNRLTTGWYRFTFPGKENGMLARIPTSPPATQYTYSGKTCGTNVSAWMFASLPVLGDPPKDVTMKMAYNGRADYDSKWGRAAKVVACNDESGNIYYLYYLRSTLCTMLYCATTQF